MDTFKLIFSVVLLLYAANLVRAWVRPTTIRSSEMRESFELWRSSLGTGPFFAAHIAVPLWLGLTGIVAWASPSLPYVAEVRVALLVGTALYLAWVFVANFSELKNDPRTAKILRTCASIAVVTLLLAAWLGAALLA